MSNKLTLFILGAASILLGYVMMTHPFEVPDEQAHFSSVQFLANEGRMPNSSDKDNLTLEEFNVEKIFGILEGDNKYSYHPDFRLEQIPGLTGLYENQIKLFNTHELRHTYSTHGSALYPPLYYWLTWPFYSLGNQADILLRLFLSRLSSVIFAVFTVLLTYHIGTLIFAKKSYAFTLSLMSLFFPMSAYIGAGVNSDNLHNLLFTCFLYLCLRLLKYGWNDFQSICFGVVIALDLLTKPQAYIMFPILALVIVIRWRFTEWRLILHSLLFILVPVILLAGWQEIPKFFSASPYLAQTTTYGGWDNFRFYSLDYFHRLYAAMLVWYWGVYKWLGLILPRPFWWIANRLLLLGIAMTGLRLLWQIIHRKFDILSRIILFTFGANFIYVAALFWFDWQFFQQFGRSLGMQARYYMPLLSLQLFAILQGITSLGWNANIKKYLRRFLIIFFLSLHLAGTYTLLKGYYDLSSINTFISQISQYKPFFAKGSWWYLWLSLYFAGIITPTIIALKSNPKE